MRLALALSVVLATLCVGAAPARAAAREAAEAFGRGDFAGVMSACRADAEAGAIPENINFAVNGDDAQVFLKAQGIEVEAAPPSELLSTAAWPIARFK
jgi:hypothetical protein